MMLAALLCSLTLVATPPPASSSPWALLAEQDLQAMRQAILENHPGPVDSLNPGFKSWVEGGYREALNDARRARSFGGYASALRRYAAGFRDGHLSVRFELVPTSVRWPGFLVALRQGRLVVAIVDGADTESGGLPPLNSSLLECDGRSAWQLFEQEVWPFAGGADIEASRVRLAPLLLQDRGQLGGKRVERCRFQVGDEVLELAVRYRDIASDALDEMERTAAFGDKPSLGVRAFGKRGLWVSLPTFDTGTDPEAFDSLRDLVKAAPGWRDAEVLVFDLRGNSGGDSTWGTQLLQALYGEDFHAALVEGAESRKAQYVEWRASVANQQHLEALVARAAGQLGPEAPTAKWARLVVAGLADARKQGRGLWRSREEASPPRVPGLFPRNPVRGRVYLLTDGRCASACLDFVDALRLMPRVLHGGQPTSADSVYMEARPVALPSGAARLSLPIKVYRNRPRGHNVPYVPQARFEGFMGDTAALERWVEGLASGAMKP
jgi:hypothetical protein